MHSPSGGAKVALSQVALRLIPLERPGSPSAVTALCVLTPHQRARTCTSKPCADNLAASCQAHALVTSKPTTLHWKCTPLRRVAPHRWLANVQALGRLESMLLNLLLLQLLLFVQGLWVGLLDRLLHLLQCFPMPWPLSAGLLTAESAYQTAHQSQKEQHRANNCNPAGTEPSQSLNRCARITDLP